MSRLIVTALVVASCSPQPSSRPSPVAPTLAPPPSLAAPPAPAGPPASAGAQKFTDGDLGYRFADPERKNKLVAAAPKIDIAVADEMTRQRLPGLALGVVVDGELVYAKGYGITDVDAKAPPDLDTAYRIGSLTKSFTALGVLALRDDRTLMLDDPLVRWVPEAAGLVYPTRDARPITLRQLITHTSGLPREYDRTKTATEAEIFAQLQGLVLDNPPGQTFAYSNLGFVMLGAVVAHASHATFRDVIAKRIFGPLGMTATAFDSTPKLAPAYKDDNHTREAEISEYRLAVGGGGIVSTVRDLARYVAFQLGAYPPRNDADTGPIRRATVRESHATGVATGAGIGPRRDPKPGELSLELDATTYGFGWQAHRTCDVDDLVEHNGAIDSYRSTISMLVRHGVGVVVLSNFGNAGTTRIANRVITELRATGALLPYVAHPPIAAGFDAAMTRFLAVYNAPTEAGLREVLSREPDPREVAELAGYLKLHGACSGFTLAEARTANQARFTMQCERGRFELEATLERGKLGGFTGISRQVAIPAAVSRNAADAMSLIGTWNDAVFARAFASAKVRDTIRSASRDLRAGLGACRVNEVVHEGEGWGIDARCDHGTAHFYIELAGDKLSSILVTRRDGSPCAAN